MLTESQVVPPTSPEVGQQDSVRLRGRQEQDVDGSIRVDQDGKKSLSHQMETTARLFEILSARSDIDHPVCVECTDLLVEGLQKRLEDVTRERDAFVGFLKQVNADVPTEEEKQKAEEELQAVRQEEEAAFTKLQQLEQEKVAVDKEIAKLEEEARQLDIEEEKFWRERNAFAVKLSEFQNERDSVNLQYDHDSRQLERLQRTNVYNDTFCIGHDGYFGTINGLRLGRLPNQPVEWAEINAAWGQTLLLLATVADKLAYTFDGYKLKPMGSTSIIEKYEYPHAMTSGSQTPGQSTTASAPKISVLELFSSGDLPIGRMFLHRKFDNAMVAFLECLRQLGDYVERQTQTGNTVGRRGGVAGGSPNTNANTASKVVELPYEIKKDKIGDASIKLGFNQDEGWTRACKYTLTCCKFVLAHASNLGGSGRRTTSATITATTTGGGGSV